MRVVILGTGTGVGKTYVTCRIAEGLRGRAGVLALKPVETGVSSAQSGDAAAIAAAAGHAVPSSPWRFVRAVSAHLAAREAGAVIDPRDWAGWVAREEVEAATGPLSSSALSSARVTLVETAGGAFSPVGPTATNVDLALSLGSALWLLVAPDALGVLNDVTTTLRALPRPPDAVVLSGARPADDSTGTNASELAALGIARPLCVIGQGARDASAIVDWLLDKLDE